MTPTADRTWLAVLDSRAGRLFELSRTPRGSRHLELHDEVAEVWEEKEHGRPSMLAARGHPMAGWRREDEERLRRFARLAADWLGRHIRQRGLERVVVFAPRQLLGELRRKGPAALLQRIELKGGDLGWMRPAELAAHPATARLAP